MKEFESLLKDEGVPITEAEIKAVFKQTVTDSGSKISNDSAYSPFWRLISAIAIQPVTWLVEALLQSVMPQFFLKTVGEDFIELWGNNYGVERKQAQRLKGRVVFSRSETDSTLIIPKGSLVFSERLNDKVYQLETLAETQLLQGETRLSVEVQATDSGGAYNLETGYFQTCDIAELSVINPDNWIDVLGADYEEIEDYRLRIRNAFNALSHYHTDGVYRFLIAKFAGVSTDMIWFKHDAPRGPGTADAYVLFELDAPSESYLKTINRLISDEGYHGHGDDLQVFNMPEKYVDLTVTVYLPTTLLDSERRLLLLGVEQATEAAFRFNSAYVMTQTQPYSRFSFTRLASEIYQRFPEIESIEFDQGDILTELEIPRLASLNVLEG
jgi:uncharacterized phage protein gp47/JayE